LNLYAPILFLTLFTNSTAVFAVEVQTAASNPQNTLQDFECGVEEKSSFDIDAFQKYWSHKILVFSSSLDNILSGSSPQENNDTLSVVNTTDLDETDLWWKEAYIDRKNRSYVRMRVGYDYDWRGEKEEYYKITARIKLPKTQDRLQLFIGDDTQENTNLSSPNYGGGNQGLGLKYFIPPFFDRFNTTAAVGITSIDNPYAKARIEYPAVLESWLFNGSQNFKLSADNEFEEWTSLFFDRKLSNQEMVRLLLQRSTKSGEHGMNYLSQFSYMNILKYDVGFNNYISISGRTHDLDDIRYTNNTTPQEGIYEYAAGVIWRQKLVGDYLFYQLQPIVSFHEQYDYKANYVFRISLDFYFGNNR
jgi:hypothetical protein